jgi:heme/copper-type cytochrome/quinol oxidase subunit 2
MNGWTLGRLLQDREGNFHGKQFVARTPGTYSFHCCNRCGIGHGGMKGQLIVEP